MINFFKWEIMDYDRDEVLFMLDDLLKDSYDYTHAGVAVHLGDRAMEVYAERWFEIIIGNKENRRKPDAKYKIYIPDTTCFVYEKALPDILEIFAADDKIAALGVCGAKSLPNAGSWQQADDKLGAVYALQEDGSVWEQRYTMPANSYEYAQYINEVMLAVQYDVECKEAAGNDLYAMEYSREVIRQGYKIVVSRQITIWCLSTSLEQLKQDFC